MGRRKELTYYNGYLKGDYLTDKDCQVLDNLIALSDKNGCIEDLRHIIYDLSPDEIELIKSSKSTDFVDKHPGKLTDAQTVGVAYMFFAKRAVLGDSVGLGKTVEVCGLCNLLSLQKEKEGVAFRFLYLTEKNLLDQTRDKIIRFTGEYIELLRGDRRFVEKFTEENSDELLYSVVGAHSLINSVEFQEYLRTYKAYYGCCPFDALFIDESAIVGNTSTKTYKNAQILADDFDWIVVMNATPFESNLRTFYAQINLCDESLLPTKTVFQNLYEVRDYRWKPPRFSGKYKNVDIFKKQVRYRYLARTRKGIGATMKNCTARVIVTKLSGVQNDLLKKTSMPQMVYDAPGYFDDGIETNKYTTPKIGAVLDLLHNELKYEKSIIIYSRHKESQRGLMEAIESEGVSCEVLNGDTDWKDKNSITTRFRMGDFRVLITNVQKGLDFDNCDNCIFYSYDPNPNRMVQLEGRMTRSENIINKHVYLIVSEGKEFNRFKEVVSDRAKASDLFAGSDFSCVLSLLLNSDILQ